MGQLTSCVNFDENTQHHANKRSSKNMNKTPQQKNNIVRTDSESMSRVLGTDIFSSFEQTNAFFSNTNLFVTSKNQLNHSMPDLEFDLDSIEEDMTFEGYQEILKADNQCEDTPPTMSPINMEGQFD